jgi:metallo-beta-lactamase class B
VRRFNWRDLLLILFAIALIPATFIGFQWRTNSERHGQDEAEPFHIAGNFYFVGASDVSIFLITSPEGHVLIDGGYPIMAPMIAASIAKLGFDIKDVKAILNTSPRPDLAGGLAELQRASGATLWANDVNAKILTAGGDDAEYALPLRAAVRIGLLAYTAPRVDRRFKDGDTIRVGSIAVTPHITGGGVRGCTTWTFPIGDADNHWNVVHACGPSRVYGMRYPGLEADIERSLRELRALRPDIWVTSHGRAWGRYRKFVASTTAKNPVDPFLDHDGYREFIDAAETEFRDGVVH